MTSVTRTPMQLHKGDTIVRHPDTGQYGEWTVQSRAYTPGDMVTITYTCDHGAEGVLVVDPVAELQVQPEPRMALVHGLRELATFLETHPDVPFRRFESASIQHSVDVFTKGLDAQRAEVDRIAEAMGVQSVDERGHYAATKYFGPVSYRAVSLQDDEDQEAGR